MQRRCDVLTVTLNPAIDRTVTITDFAAGKVNRVEHVVQHPGGKGVNVAVTLADDGRAVAATGSRTAWSPTRAQLAATRQLSTSSPRAAVA